MNKFEIWQWSWGILQSLQIQIQTLDFPKRSEWKKSNTRWKIEAEIDRDNVGKFENVLLNDEDRIDDVVLQRFQRFRRLENDHTGGREDFRHQIADVEEKTLEIVLQTEILWPVMGERMQFRGEIVLRFQIHILKQCPIIDGFRSGTSGRTEFPHEILLPWPRLSRGHL